MNRLWVRLSLAFLSVTLVTVAIVAFLAAWTTDDQFRRFAALRDEMEATLTAEANESTDGSAASTPAPNENSSNNRPGSPNNRPGGGPNNRPGMSGPPVRPPEQDFLDRIRVLLIVAALIAGLVGTGLGFAISRTIAAPLANLSLAAQDLAARRWDRRVPVEGSDELAEVARAFNAMADALQRAEILRRNLMADIAHELRTPLTVMQGNLRAILDGVYPLEMKEVATLYDETRLLSRLVADLRELALAEAGQFPLNLRPVELAPILQQAVEQFSPAAEAQETSISFVPGEAVSAYADPDRLAQILHNLIANALRHTPGGSVRITARTQADGIRIDVTDTGEGISAEDLPHIFDRFYRGDDTRPGSNTGLGLAIAKAWVEAMGGTIGASSTPGQGSSFWFTLRPAPPASKT